MLWQEVTLTSPILITTLEFIALIGFGILAIITFIAYGNLNSKMLLYIALAFTVLFISMIFQVVLPLMSTVFPGDTDIFDITGEIIQFFAAFLFLAGLKLIKE